MKSLTFLLVFVPLLSVCRSQSETGVDEELGDEEHVELFTTATTKLAAATSDFGYNLYRALASQDASSNVLLAPLSVSTVLTQLSMGASETAERQLYRALRYHTLQDPQLHNTLRDLLTSTGTTGKGLSTAARVYLSRRLRVKPEFLRLVEQQFGTAPKQLMGGAKDLKDINDWVSQGTGGKVQRFLTKPFPRNTGVNTVSAAHFKGKWENGFSQSNSLESFQIDGGTTVRVPMMHQDNYPVKMGVDSDLSCTIAQIQMQDSVSIFVFLPNDVSANLTTLEESLTAEFVQDLSMTLLPAEVSLMLPVLSFSSTNELQPLLADLGLSDWLTSPGLEKITAQPVKLGTVNHKVVMEMVAEGNRYASSTSPPSHLALRVDKPFLFLVRDESSGALLLVGRMVNPKNLRI
ncbi:pigment epithelium-derived factor isoform X2 [Gouania willdenowi]|uniref:Serpin domain-containing protein n=2 Tax=Gouania willdenowi TaxID=441366 RepID=A0A8C5EDA2_GOUWI|nr:pigment epithelium-derived factor isoform X2 [Gouania willdenowi]